MSVYIFGRIRKEDMYARLSARKSIYAVLYKEAYPKKDNAYSAWAGHFGEQTDTANNLINTELTYEDSVAIVNWVYRTMKNAEERTQFTLELFEHIKELYGIRNRIKATPHRKR